MYTNVGRGFYQYFVSLSTSTPPSLFRLQMFGPLSPPSGQALALLCFQFPNPVLEKHPVGNPHKQIQNRVATNTSKHRRQLDGTEGLILSTLDPSQSPISVQHPMDLARARRPTHLICLQLLADVMDNGSSGKFQSEIVAKFDPTHRVPSALFQGLLLRERFCRSCSDAAAIASTGSHWRCGQCVVGKVSIKQSRCL